MAWVYFRVELPWSDRVILALHYRWCTMGVQRSMIFQILRKSISLRRENHTFIQFKGQ